MNNFKQLYDHVMLVEKGYNPNDQGNETYSGIWRGAHPDWPGWRTIDAIKKTRKIKRGDFIPDVEDKVQAFYRDFWAPVQVEKIAELRIAEMLVDMRTQHGRWAMIVRAGLNNLSPITGSSSPNTSIPNTLLPAHYVMMNTAPQESYKKIAAARLLYAQKIHLTNEKDRKAIINRAMKYVTNAATWLASNPSATGSAMIIAAFFFWF